MDNDLIQDTNLDLLQVNAVEVEYSGIAPINVDNQEHTISLDPSALSSKLDTSAFDEWTATHSAGEEYSAGEGIDITDHVISYTGDPGDATPWISGNKIITSADTMQPGEFIQVVSSFDLSGNKNHFITVKGQGYYFPTNQQLKERVGVDEYLPLSSFSSYTASIANNLENNWNYTNSAYSQSLNNYYNKLDISAFSSWSSEHSGDYLTKESADTLYQPIGDYLTTADSGNFYPMEGNPSGFLTGVDLSNYYEKNETSSKEEISSAITSVENIINNLSGEYYPLNSNPSGYLTAHQDISDKLDVTAFTAYTATAQGTEYSAGDNIDITNHVISGKDWTSTIESATSGKLDTTAFNSGDFYPMTGNPSGFITGVDLTPYQEKTGMTAYQPVGDYYSASNPSGFITGVDLSNYYEKNETSSKEEISAALENAGIEYTGIAPIDVNNTTHQISADVWTLSGTSGIEILEDAENKVTTLAYTAQPDLSNYYTKSDIQSQSGNYLPMITTGLSASGTYLIDANSNNRILGINTSGISANPNGGVTSVQVGGYNSPEIKIKGYYGTMELNSAGAQYISSDNSVVWKVGEADHLYVTNSNPDYQGIAIDIASAPRNVDTTRVMIGKNGLSACNIGSSAGMNTTYAPATVVGNSQVKVDYGNMHSVLTVGDVYVNMNDNAASSKYSLTGSVQKRELEYDTATSAITAIAGSAIGGGGGGDTIDLSAGEGISIVETADKVVISNNISAGSNMSFVYDSETNKIRIDGADAFPITATDGNTTWSADCKASAFTMARNTSRTDIGAFGFEYRQAPSVNVSGTWYDLALLMEKFKYAIPAQVVANSGLATGQNILYIITGA